jgi:hypothetical protein
MNRPHLLSRACALNMRRRASWLAAALLDLAMLCTAALIPATSAQSAVAIGGGVGWFSVGQVDAVLPRATMVAPPPSDLPRFALIATMLPQALGLKALAQPSIAARLALQAPTLQPGQGAVTTDNSFGPAVCDGADSRAECLLRQDLMPDWRMAVKIDPVSGAALAPGVTSNPTRTPYNLGEVLTYLASASASPDRVWPTFSRTAASFTASDGVTSSGSSISILLSPTSSFNMIMGGEYYSVTVDLTSATEASYVTGLTLSSYNTSVMTTAPGGTLQLNNITLTAGSPALKNSLILSNALNGFISVLGGATDGSGITKVATVSSLSMLQSGAAHVVSLGLNGTTGTVTAVLQSGTGVKTLQFDNYTSDMVMNVSQTGHSSHAATGIVLKAAPDSIFVLRQQ